MEYWWNNNDREIRISIIFGIIMRVKCEYEILVG